MWRRSSPSNSLHHYSVYMALLSSLVVLLPLLQSVSAQEGTGHLPFLPITSPETLPNADQGRSNAISTLGGIHFGRTTIHHVYVSSNGYISMARLPSVTSPVIPKHYFIVSPYGADIDTRIAGSVRYRPFTTVDSQQSVNKFIRSKTRTSFAGTKMMVAEWNKVAKYNGRSSNTSHFQAVLIANDTATYAVFLYKCGGLNWDGAVIGWAYNTALYKKNTFSGSRSELIGCRYSNTTSAVIYRIDDPKHVVVKGCGSGKFTCKNKKCIADTKVCDGVDDCGDNSDEEENCSEDGSDDSGPLLTMNMIIGLAVGVAVIVCCILTIIGCCLCCVCSKKSKSAQPNANMGNAGTVFYPPPSPQPSALIVPQATFPLQPSIMHTVSPVYHHPPSPVFLPPPSPVYHHPQQPVYIPPPSPQPSAHSINIYTPPAAPPPPQAPSNYTIQVGQPPASPTTLHPHSPR